MVIKENGPTSYSYNCAYELSIQKYQAALILNFLQYGSNMPIPVATRCKA